MCEYKNNDVQAPEAPPARPEPPKEADSQNAIVEFGMEKVPDSGQSPIHCVTIVGQIEGHMVLPAHNKATKYEHILPMLVAIEQSQEIKGFLLLLNTVGGDVEAGLAIAEMVASMKTPSVSVVLGGGHSIGVPLAVSARKSFIAGTATMTVHPIRMSGMIIGVPQTYEYMEKMQERVARFVCAHSRIQKERFEELTLRMGQLANDVGTVLIGQEAVECGLIDAVGGISEALDALDQMIKEESA